MNQKEKRQLDNQLLAMGLANLSDPELIQQLADLVSDWRGDRHQFLQDLLNECEPTQRYEMYQAIAPKLKFKALSLQQYECRIAEQAGAAVSHRKMRVEGNAPHPIEIGEQRFMVTTPQHASGAVATLTCHKCGKTAKFLSDSPAGAMIEGRKAGWVRDAGVNKEICGECACLAAQRVMVVDRRSLA